MSFLVCSGDEVVDGVLAVPLPDRGLVELPVGKPKRTKRCSSCTSHAENRKACSNLKKVSFKIICLVLLLFINT
jgi:hypothetical protein